jgi:leader peptidase (prepilin peptidase) / N-methyltransferase
MIMLMNELVIYAALIVTGLCFGSFAGATVWRLRARQLVEDKELGEDIDNNEYKRLKPLLGKTASRDRSQCLNCRHELRWYDLLPLVSWLQLSGRCRYCKRAIGGFEPVIEIATAAIFAFSYMLWPLPLDDIVAWMQLLLWLVAMVCLVILFVYDLKWFLLPNSVVFTFIGLGAVYASLVLYQAPDMALALLSILGALMVLSGLYYVLFQISNGAWIGFGDIKLGIGLALFLADWRLALLALFAANVIGLMLVLPLMVTGKVTRTSRVPFGPMLIIGFVLSAIWGHQLLEAYFFGLVFY